MSTATEVLPAVSVPMAHLPIGRNDESVDTGELDLALLEAQAEFPDVPKDQISEYHHGDPYSSLYSILKSTRPSLVESKLLLRHTVQIRGNTVIVKAILTHVPSKQWRSETLEVDSDRRNPQAVGSSITYLRKYTTYPILGIAPGEDDDGLTARQASEQREERSRGRREEPQRERSRDNGERRRSADNKPAANRQQQNSGERQTATTAATSWPQSWDVSKLIEKINTYKTLKQFLAAWKHLLANDRLVKDTPADWKLVLAHFVAHMKVVGEPLMSDEKAWAAFTVDVTPEAMEESRLEMREEQIRMGLIEVLPTSASPDEPVASDQPAPAADEQATSNQGTESDGTDDQAQ